MSSVTDLFTGQAKPGMYRLRSNANIETLQRQAKDHGWQFFHVDGAKVQDKRSFIRTVGKALDFPTYSAQNWDAFEESIRDLTWSPAKGYLVLFDEPDQFAAQDPEQWAIARRCSGGYNPLLAQTGHPDGGALPPRRPRFARHPLAVAQTPLGVEQRVDHFLPDHLLPHCSRSRLCLLRLSDHSLDSSSLRRAQVTHATLQHADELGLVLSVYSDDDLLGVLRHILGATGL